MGLKKVVLILAFPLSITAAFSGTYVIPRAVQDLKLFFKNEAKFVFKNAKGTFLAKTPSTFLSVRPENWFNLLPADGAEGVGAEETYKAFGIPVSDDIVVAVIDSGVDVNHEDLQGKIWINADEVANDGIDNDGNGYVDDVFGWNFIGGSDGMASIVMDSSLKNGMRLIKGNPKAQIHAETREVTRELVRMKKLKDDLINEGKALSKLQRNYLKRLEGIVSYAIEEATNGLETYSKDLKIYKNSETILTRAGLASMSIEEVRAFESNDEGVLAAKKTMINFLSNDLTEVRLNRVLAAYKQQLNYHYNESFNPRSIVGDESGGLEQIYGNNDVTGLDASHGTHVSGTIAAARENGLGMKGVATNVKIMAIRVVPAGDERDKDVANGIRYAVDNGARIINMSFGKEFSPNKEIVDEAVRYAESKGVLLVHAAGNSSQDNDKIEIFPNRYDKRNGKKFSNWLEIGASSFEIGLSLPAEFSNFGKKSVDLFAPGVDIFSTTPGNKYDTFSGTSMAAPVASGVAALLLSYDSSLDAHAVKSLMIDTSRRYSKLKVHLPGTKTQVPFKSLSTYGSVLDVYNASKRLK